MGVPVKICGLTTAPTLETAVTHGADYVGFVLVPGSPRNILPEDVRPLIEAARGRTQSVVLICDPDDDTVDAVKELAPDYIQLHGHETVDRVFAVKSRSALPVIKAIGVEEESDLAGVTQYQDAADIVLLDAKPPAGSEITGGHGHTFDWDLLSGEARPTVDFILSGGLTPDNVARAIDQTRPSAV